MTFFHLINCMGLACLPHFIVYKFSGLADYSAFWKCVQVIGAYVLTQLVKMISLATFFPSINPESAGSAVSLLLDFLRSTVDIVDLVGLSIVLQRLAGKGQIRLLTAGLGWAVADLITTRLLPLWVGTRGLEFDWKFVRLALHANLDLVQHMAVALLVWLYSRQDLERRLRPAVTGALLLCVYRPLLHDLLLKSRPAAEITLFGVNGVTILLIGVFSLHLYHQWSADIAARASGGSGQPLNGKSSLH